MINCWRYSLLYVCDPKCLEGNNVVTVHPPTHPTKTYPLGHQTWAIWVLHLLPRVCPSPILLHSPWPRQCYLPDLDWGACKIRHRWSICLKDISTSLCFHTLKQLHFTMTGNRSISHSGNKPDPFSYIIGCSTPGLSINDFAIRQSHFDGLWLLIGNKLISFFFQAAPYFFSLLYEFWWRVQLKFFYFTKFTSYN